MTDNEVMVALLMGLVDEYAEGYAGAAECCMPVGEDTLKAYRELREAIAKALAQRNP